MKEIEFQAEEQIVGGTLSLVGNGGLAETTPVWNSLTLIVNPQLDSRPFGGTLKGDWSDI